MQAGWVGGIYLERDKARLLLAQSDTSSLPYPTLHFEAYDGCDWNPSDRSEALGELSDFARKIAERFPDLKSLAIAGYGPFANLTRSHQDYGLVHPDTADPPLAGENLYKIFRAPFAYIGAEPIITVHTDANALAIGEAMARDLPPDHVLVSVLVTEGVGGGLVVGRDLQPSALHPEIGLLHARFKAEDPLRPEHGTRLYSRCITELADKKAMRERYSCMHGIVDPSDERILAHSDRDFWDYRAYYIAQVCLAATVFQAPHSIVLATDFGRPDALVRDTRSHLEDFWHTRRMDETPVLSYPELENWSSYITGLTGHPHADLAEYELSIPLVGAAGMCLEAARSRRNGEVREVTGHK